MKEYYEHAQKHTLTHCPLLFKSIFCPKTYKLIVQQV